MWCDSVKPWQKKRHGQIGIRSRTGSGKSTKGYGENQNVVSKERSGSFVRILRTVKPFWEDVHVILMRKVIEWSFNLKRSKDFRVEEKHRRTALVEGDEGSQWRKRNKKKQLDREESKRTSSMEKYHIFCWPVCVRPRSKPCRVSLLSILMLKHVRLWKFLVCCAVPWHLLN